MDLRFTPPKSDPFIYKLKPFPIISKKPKKVNKFQGKLNKLSEPPLLFRRNVSKLSLTLRDMLPDELYDPIFYVVG